jgi:hypothetical protein
LIEHAAREGFVSPAALLDGFAAWRAPEVLRA